MHPVSRRFFIWGSIQKYIQLVFPKLYITKPLSTKLQAVWPVLCRETSEALQSGDELQGHDRERSLQVGTDGPWDLHGDPGSIMLGISAGLDTTHHSVWYHAQPFSWMWKRSGGVMFESDARKRMFRSLWCSTLFWWNVCQHQLGDQCWLQSEQVFWLIVQESFVCVWDVLFKGHCNQRHLSQ